MKRVNLLGPGPRLIKKVNLLGPGPRLMKKVNLLGPGPRLMKKEIYRPTVSQRLRNAGLVDGGIGRYAPSLCFLAKINLSSNFSVKSGNLGISGFRRQVDENCALLSYYAASSANLCPTFRDNICR